MAIRFLKFIYQTLQQSLRTSWVLFKIMIPVSIVIKVVTELGLLPYIGKILSPIMKLVGLPGEMGIVWATSLLVNIYGGLLSFVAIAWQVEVSHAQLTVLLSMILVAHSFPVELQISSKAGVKLWVMFVIRFGFAIVLGVILNLIYTYGNYLQEAIVLNPIVSNRADSLWLWALNELKNYALIIVIIFVLILALKLLEKVGVVKLLNKMLYPVLKVLGIGKEVIPISLIGLTLGLSYGGALIIDEAKTKKLPKRDVFYAMTLMGLCHSMIEDTLLMISFGGHVSGIVFARIIFALIITYIIVSITKRMDDSRINSLMNSNL